MWPNSYGNIVKKRKWFVWFVRICKGIDVVQTERMNSLFKDTNESLDLSQIVCAFSIDNDFCLKKC